MSRQFSIFLITLSATFSNPTFANAQEAVATGETDGMPSVAFLIEALENRDEGIRREAFRRLEEDESLPVVPELVETLRYADLGSAARAALVLAARFELLRRNRDGDTPRLVLTNADKQDLAPVGAILRQKDAEHWRWYLAEWILERVHPEGLEQHLPALVDAVREALPMRQYAAVRALRQLGERAGPQAKTALIEALGQPFRPKFVGVYLRYQRVIERNAVAFTADVWAASGGPAQLRFCADDDLLITDALLAVGAVFDDLDTPLTALSRHENESVRLQAARQLTRLGPRAFDAADAALAVLLADRSSPLVRQLAEEDSPSRAEAIDLISRLDSQAREVILPLAGLLDSNQDRLRQSAAIALGRLGKAALPALPALKRAIAMETLLAGPAGVVSPQSKARAVERLADMREAARQIESP